MADVPANVVRIEQIRDVAFTRTDVENWSCDGHRPVNLAGMYNAGNPISDSHNVNIRRRERVTKLALRLIRKRHDIRRSGAFHFPLPYSTANEKHDQPRLIAEALRRFDDCRQWIRGPVITAVHHDNLSIQTVFS